MAPPSRPGWSEALAGVLSDLIGRPVRVVEAGEEGAADGGPNGAVSLISRASLERLASEGDLDGIDGRRFRMLLEVEGLDAHAEGTRGWARRRGSARPA